jgi:hypothetical protein
MLPNKLPVRRILSPALLLGVLACFFLPFATVSCDGEQVTPTAMQLVVGDAPVNEGSGELDQYGGSLGQDVVDEAQPFAIVAFAGVVLALASALFLRLPSRVVFLFSELGFLALTWLAVDGEISDAEVTLGPGFWLAWFGLLGSMAVQGPAMRRRGLWACVVIGIPGSLHPLALVVFGAVVGATYACVAASRRPPSPSQELRPPSAVQTTGKNDSSIEVSPTRL